MKRILAWAAIVLTAGAFILLCLVWLLKINILIPIAMFVLAFILLGVVKKMPDDDAAPSDTPDDRDGGQ